MDILKTWVREENSISGNIVKTIKKLNNRIDIWAPKLIQRSLAAAHPIIYPSVATKLSCIFQVP